MDILSITETEDGNKIEFLTGNDIRFNGEIIGSAVITDDYYKFIPSEGVDISIALTQLIECVIADQIES